ncbi:hypothetical protein GCM10008997_02970 [Halomonas salifodinae]
MGMETLRREEKVVSLPNRVLGDHAEGAFGERDQGDSGALGWRL